MKKPDLGKMMLAIAKEDAEADERPAYLKETDGE